MSTLDDAKALLREARREHIDVAAFEAGLRSTPFDYKAAVDGLDKAIVEVFALQPDNVLADIEAIIHKWYEKGSCILHFGRRDKLIELLREYFGVDKQDENADVNT